MNVEDMATLDQNVLPSSEDRRKDWLCHGLMVIVLNEKIMVNLQNMSLP
jgi:hypothetical protein